MNPVAKNVFRIASFATVIVPMVCMHVFLERGSSSFTYLARIWIAAALSGTVFAWLGGGGPRKRPTEIPEAVAMALNLSCLVVLGFIALASTVHPD